MAFQEITFLKYASDLVVDHADFHFSNENANITPAGVIKLGTIVTRAKTADVDDPWTVLTAAAAVVDTNDFAVVFGDHHSFRYDFTPKAIAAGKWNAIVINRDAAFKEFYIKENYATVLGAAPYSLLKQLMRRQGLLFLDDVTKYKVA